MTCKRVPGFESLPLRQVIKQNDKQANWSNKIFCLTQVFGAGHKDLGFLFFPYISRREKQPHRNFDIDYESGYIQKRLFMEGKHDAER